MARPTYASLITPFDYPVGTTTSYQTVANATILQLMKDAFRVFAKGEYDTYSASVDHPTVDTTDVYGVIIRRASHLMNQWIQSAVEKEKMVDEIKLTSEDIEDIGNAINKPMISYDFIQRQEDSELGIHGETDYGVYK